MGLGISSNNYNFSTIRVSGSDVIYEANLSGIGLATVTRSGNLILFNAVSGGNVNNTYNITGFGVTGISISGGNSLTGQINIVPGANIVLTQLGDTGFSITSSAVPINNGVPFNLMTGFGTSQYIAKFTPDNSGLINSTIIDSGTSVSFLQPVILNSGITFNSGIIYNYTSGEVVRHRAALKFVNITQADYTALNPPDSETLYIIAY